MVTPSLYDLATMYAYECTRLVAVSCASGSYAVPRSWTLFTQDDLESLGTPAQCHHLRLGSCGERSIWLTWARLIKWVKLCSPNGNFPSSLPP
eukprot:1764505-Amphidinium_carterae.1